MYDIFSDIYDVKSKYLNVIKISFIFEKKNKEVIISITFILNIINVTFVHIS